MNMRGNKWLMGATLTVLLASLTCGAVALADNELTNRRNNINSTGAIDYGNGIYMDSDDLKYLADEMDSLEANSNTRFEEVAAQVEKTANNIAPEYRESTSYPKGSVILKDGVLYMAEEDISGGAFDENKWKKVDFSDLLSKIQDNTNSTSSAIGANIASDFDKDSPYQKGDIVVRGGKLYQAKGDIAEGNEFNPEEWEQITLSNLLGEIQARLDSEDEHIKDSMAQTYKPGVPYNEGDVVLYDGKLYTAKKSLAPEDNDEWRAAYWEPTSFAGLLNKINGNMAETWNEDEDYPKGAVVLKNGKLYRAKTNTTGGDGWINSQWEGPFTIDELINDMKEEIENTSNAMGESIAELYEDSNSYAEHTVVYKDGKLYRAKLDIPKNTAFSLTNWEEVSLSSLLREIVVKGYTVGTLSQDSNGKYTITQNGALNE